MSLYNESAVRRRNAFFSFHYADIMRVNVVRQSNKFQKSPLYDGRHIQGYYDRSLWESRKTNGPDAVKTLIRDGMHNSSVACVLAGSETWLRRWVRYEIARSVIDERGLITININSIKSHNFPFLPELRGSDPCYYMGVGRLNGSFYLYEMQVWNGAWHWSRYSDYTSAVPLPQYMHAPAEGAVHHLSNFIYSYDWITNVGHETLARGSTPLLRL